MALPQCDPLVRRGLGAAGNPAECNGMLDPTPYFAHRFFRARFRPTPREQQIPRQPSPAFSSAPRGVDADRRLRAEPFPGFGRGGVHGVIGDHRSDLGR